MSTTARPSETTLATLRSMATLARFIDVAELRAAAAECRREASWAESTMPILLHENSGRRLHENIESSSGMARILDAAADLAEAVVAHPGTPEGPLVVPGGEV